MHHQSDNERFGICTVKHDVLAQASQQHGSSVLGHACSVHGLGHPGPTTDSDFGNQRRMVLRDMRRHLRAPRVVARISDPRCNGLTRQKQRVWQMAGLVTARRNKANRDDQAQTQHLIRLPLPDANWQGRLALPVAGFKLPRNRQEISAVSDLFDDPVPGENSPEFSVTEISGAIKRVIEGEFGHVRIRGEVGRVSMPRSGHIYLDLKDDRSVISGVIWKGVAGRLATKPEEGMEVIATGRITTFGGQSKYQIVIEDIRPAGMGALMAMLEKRKAALQAEGLFDPARKKKLPYLPEIIGVVTSPSGAVIRDILHRLRDRFPRKVLIWPVAVQGAACAPEVARAIRGFNAMTPGGALPRPDLLIVARGGGSIEDLWGFNEEIVARAAAESEIPLISAVGHETDTTLIDFVSDLRAPTPTAAAEHAVPVRLELLSWVGDAQARLGNALTGRLDRSSQRLRDLARALPRPETLLDGPRQRLDVQSDRLPAALIRSVQIRRVTLSDIAGSLRPSLLHRATAAERRRLAALAPRLAPALSRSTKDRRNAFEAISVRLSSRPISADLGAKQRTLADLTRRLTEAQSRRIDEVKTKLEGLDRLRETLGHRATLARGYAIVHGDDKVVTNTAAAAAATAIEIEFADGRFKLGSAPTRKRSAKKPPEQGSLF